MARGDFDATALLAMSERANHEDRLPFSVAEDALRIAPQLTSADLQTCIAFRIDPFAWLAAKLSSTDMIAAEREERIRTLDFLDRERREREAWGEAELERLRSL